MSGGHRRHCAWDWITREGNQHTDSSLSRSTADRAFHDADRGACLRVCTVRHPAAANTASMCIGRTRHGARRRINCEGTQRPERPCCGETAGCASRGETHCQDSESAEPTNAAAIPVSMSTATKWLEHGDDSQGKDASVHTSMSQWHRRLCIWRCIPRGATLSRHCPLPDC